MCTRAVRAQGVLMIYAANDPSVVQLLPPLTMPLADVPVVCRRLARAAVAARRLLPLYVAKQALGSMLPSWRRRPPAVRLAQPTAPAAGAAPMSATALAACVLAAFAAGAALAPAARPAVVAAVGRIAVVADPAALLGAVLIALLLAAGLCRLVRCLGARSRGSLQPARAPAQQLPTLSQASKGGVAGGTPPRTRARSRKH